MPSLRILADENIPLVEELFGSIGTVHTVPGRSITREMLVDVDVLLVRSVTPVRPALLEGTGVRFVGSATIGLDHIETDYLDENEISWASAPGSNAESVVEHVIAALASLSVRLGEPLRGKTLGIIGVGSIGGRLAPRAEALGMRVLKNDPPREEREGPGGHFTPLDTLLRESDVVTCHVPLNRGELHATYHLIGERELGEMRRGAWLINTSRGGVVDNAALLAALRRSSIAAAALDVWEGEPSPAPALVESVDLATPHIAGYSYDGKVAGTLMLLDAIEEVMDVSIRPKPDALDTSRRTIGAPDAALPEADWLDQLVRQMYDIRSDDRRMRTVLAGSNLAEEFVRLRRDYPKRRTFGSFDMQEAQMSVERRTAVEGGLMVRLRAEPHRARFHP